MRVTDKMTFEVAGARVAAAQEKMAAASAQVSNGRRVVQPWDDPVAAGQLALNAANQHKLSGWMNTANRAQDELNVADGSLDGVSNALSRARELAVQLSNATYNAAERAQGAGEIKQLKAQIIAALNVDSGGRYLLGGQADGAPPFDATGAYVGDAGVRNVEVGPGLHVAASVRADVAIKGVGGGADVMAALDALDAALSSNNAVGVRSTLTALDQGITQVSSMRAQLGQQVSALQLASNAANFGRVQEQVNASNLGDVDIAAASTSLALAQRAVEASMAAATRTFSLTLLDKLK